MAPGYDHRQRPFFSRQEPKQLPGQSIRQVKKIASVDDHTVNIFLSQLFPDRGVSAITFFNRKTQTILLIGSHWIIPPFSAVLNLEDTYRAVAELTLRSRSCVRARVKLQSIKRPGPWRPPPQCALQPMRYEAACARRR